MSSSVIAAVEAIYDAAPDPSRWPHALQTIANCFGDMGAIDPDANSPADPALVRDVLGLTLGEARVASLVGSGLSPPESAEKLGIAEETARTVLERVFSKTGVSRQSELVALLTKLLLR